jgi:hypothetical protein
VPLDVPLATAEEPPKAEEVVVALGTGGGRVVAGIIALVIAALLHLFQTTLFVFAVVGTTPAGCVAAIFIPLRGQFLTLVLEPACKVPLKQVQGPQSS